MDSQIDHELAQGSVRQSIEGVAFRLSSASVCCLPQISRRALDQRHEPLQLFAAIVNPVDTIALKGDRLDALR